MNETIKKIVPIKTWKPWNPVVIKKQDPKTLSEIVKGDSKYSNTRNPVKTADKKTVIIKDIKDCRFALNIIEWWHQVTVAPELNKKKLFVKGIPKVGIVVVSLGGQTPPILNTGDKLEWKNAQKKAKKNIISDTINNIIPNLIPFCTEKLCWSSKVASLIISLHQVYITYKIITKPVINILPPSM